MSKVAFLVGVPGSGKTTLATSVPGFEKSVLFGDHVIHWTSARLCPFLEPNHQWSEHYWSSMIRHCDVRSAMRRVLIDVFGSPRLPLILEGYLFAIPGLRAAFISAIRDVHRVEPASQVFWLDIEAEANVERIENRRKSERVMERPITIEESKRRQRFTKEQTAGGNVVIETDADVLRAKIQAFLESRC